MSLPMARLQRYRPSYSTWMDVSGLWWAAVRLEGGEYRAGGYRKKSEAMHGAALVALEDLEENQSVDNILYNAMELADQNDFALYRFPGDQTRHKNWHLSETMPPVSITITSCYQDISEWVRQNVADVYGLDVEWRPSFQRGERNPAALLQLATIHSCLLVQLLYVSRFPDELVNLLADPRVKLVGKGVLNDCELLTEDHYLTCNGIVDIGTCAAQQRGDPTLNQHGLANLCGVLLGEIPRRSRGITMSRWDEQYLSDAQISYAASDAWFSLRCYEAA